MADSRKSVRMRRSRTSGQEVHMPQYDYHCENCEAEFTLDLSIGEHEQKDKRHEIRCPKCESTEVKHVIQSVFVTTSKKS